MTVADDRAEALRDLCDAVLHDADAESPHSAPIRTLAAETLRLLDRAETHVAWDHGTHGPHTLLSHDDKRYAGCRANECEPLYRKAQKADGS